VSQSRCRQYSTKCVVGSRHTSTKCVVHFVNIWVNSFVTDGLILIYFCQRNERSEITIRWTWQWISNLKITFTKHCAGISSVRISSFYCPWIGFCHTGPISLCVDFLCLSVYFVCFCFILPNCCIIVSMVGSTWWDWSLIFRTLSSLSALTLSVGSFDS